MPYRSRIHLSALRRLDCPDDHHMGASMPSPRRSPLPRMAITASSTDETRWQAKCPDALSRKASPKRPFPPGSAPTQNPRLLISSLNGGSAPAMSRALSHGPWRHFCNFRRHSPQTPLCEHRLSGASLPSFVSTRARFRCCGQLCRHSETPVYYSCSLAKHPL